MKTISISMKNIDRLREFIAGMGASSQSFRYFVSRPVDVIANHVVTLLGLNEEGAAVCYGHLDREGDTVWLGICVTERFIGQGWGKHMMAKLLASAAAANVSSVALSVDTQNLGAISLYEKCGFTLTYQKGGISFYLRDSLSGSISGYAVE